MPPKKGSKKRPSSASNPCTSFIHYDLPEDYTQADIQQIHGLQLVGFAESSGFPLCSAPDVKASRLASEAAAASAKAIKSNRKPRQQPSKGEDKDDVEVFTSDDEVQEVNPPTRNRKRRRSSSISVKIIDKKCSEKLCRDNPHCLEHLGAEIWCDKERALEKFMKNPELGPNPALRSRDIGVPVGLRNLGATCYAAALLQTWFFNLPFRNAVYKLKTTLEEGQQLASSPSYQLQTLFYGLQESMLSSYDPKGLIQSLQLVEDEQQDAQEFSKLFMSLLQADFQKQDDYQLQTIVEDSFEGKMEYVTKCLKCRHESRRESPFWELELTLKNQASVENRIEVLLEHETLEGDNQYLCSKCGSKQDAERYSELKQLPPTLHLSLLRFIFDPETLRRKKAKAAIRYPPSINMARFLPDADEPMWYDLKAILVHKGDSVNSGHYCAEVYDKDSNEWFNCDDDYVSKIKSRMNSEAIDKRFSLKGEAADLPRIKKQKLENVSEGTPAKEVLLDSKIPYAEASLSQKASKKTNELPWAMETDSKPFSPQSILDNHVDRSVDDSFGHDKSQIDLQDVVELYDTNDENDSSFASKPLKDEAKSSLPTTKDAYMMVYVRRSVDSSSLELELVKPPVEVIQAITTINDLHQESLLHWNQKQKIFESAFEDVYAFKNLVISEWATQKHNETSYLVSAPALSDWVNMGIAFPKKSKKKDIKSEEFQGKEIQPEPVVAEDAGTTSEAKEKRPPTPDAITESDGTIKDSPTPEHSFSLDAVGGDAKMAVSDTTIPASISKALKDLQPLTLQNSTLEIVEEPEKDLKKRLVAGSTRSDFKNASIACEHGLLDPQKVSTAKRISVGAYQTLSNDLQCSIYPRLTTADLCADCVFRKINFIAYRDIIHPQRIQMYTELVQQENEGLKYWIPSSWISDFKKSEPPLRNRNTTDEVSPDEDRYIREVRCPHDSLIPSKKKRVAIPGPAYQFLQSFLPDYSTLAGHDGECVECEEAALPTEETAASIRAAAKEKTSLHELSKNFKEVVAKTAIIEDFPYVAISSKFIKLWSIWIKNPATAKRPTVSIHDELFCEHDLLNFNPGDPRDYGESRLAIISQADWLRLKNFYGTEHSTIDITHVSKMNKNHLVESVICSIPTCEPCRRARKSQFEKASIIVLVRKSINTSVIIPVRDRPRSESPEELPVPASVASHKSKNKPIVLSDAEPESDVHTSKRSKTGPSYGRSGVGPAPDSMRLASSTRKSKRQRMAKDKTNDGIERFEIQVGKDSAVKDIKVRAAEELDTNVMLLTLWYENEVLENAGAKLLDIGIIDGSSIEVFVTTAPDEDDAESLAEVSTWEEPSSSTAKKGRSAVQTVQGGFGGTKLTGNGGVPKKAQSPSTPNSASATPTVDDRTRSATREPSAMADEEMLSLEEDSIPCPTCTFLNHSQLDNCEVCTMSLR